MRKAIVLLAVAAAVAVGWLVWRKRQAPPLVVSGFIEADQIRVGSRVGGRIAQVLVHEGQAVAAGAILFRIEPFDLNDRLARAQAERAAAQAEFFRLSSGYRPEELAQAVARRDRLAAVHQRLKAGPRALEKEMARQKLEVARASFDLADTEQKRIAALHRQNTATQGEVDKASREYRAALAERTRAEQELALLDEGYRKEEIAEAAAALAEAQAALDLVQHGYRGEDILSAASRLAAADAEVRTIEQQVQELSIAAPADCIVEAIDLRPGDLVGPSAPAVSLLDRSKLWVRAYVPESHLARATVGRQVPIRVDGFPGERFQATVTFVSPEAEFTPRNVQTPEERSKQVFRVKLTLGAGRERLRVGMMADVLLEESR